MRCNAEIVVDDHGNAKATSAPAGYGPAQLQTAYGISGSSHRVVAIVDAFDDPTVESDLAVYSQTYGLPLCTTANGCFSKLNQRGQSGQSPATDGNWAEEISLDVETVHGVCPECRIVLVEADSASPSDLYAAEDAAVAAGATAISNSWGEAEYAAESSDDRHFDHPAIAIIASSGDTGYGAQYPAASPHVIAVGGTTLTLNSDGTRRTEKAWSGSGSGCSQYEPKPSWQRDVSCVTRTIADVSADADPKTGAAVYDSTPTYDKAGHPHAGWLVVGGTSLAAPIIAATVATASDTATANYSPFLYGHGSYPTTLFDVVSGKNGNCGLSYLCTAGTGYDGPTGLGVPTGLGAFVGAVPTFTVEPTTATAGQSLAISGTGFGVRETVTLTIGANFLGSATADANGSFAGTFNVPDVAAGSYAIRATGLWSSITMETQFAVVTAAGGADWTQDRFDAGHSGSNSSETRLGTANVGGLVLKWRAATSGPTTTAPAIANGIAYATADYGANGGALDAFNAQTGAPVWSATTGGHESHPVVADGIVYVWSWQTSLLYALDAATGRQLWTTPTTGGAPVVVGGVVYTGDSAASGVEALSGATGTVIWSQPIPCACTYTYLAAPVAYSPAVVDGVVYVETTVGTVVALNASTGAILWNTNSSGWSDSSYIAGSDRFAFSPVVVNGVMYVVVNDYSDPFGTLRALSASTGHLLWSSQTDWALSAPTVENGVVYVRSGHDLQAFDSTSGTLLWPGDGMNGQGGSPSTANGVVYVALDLGQMSARDAATGALLWQAPSQWNAFDSPVIANGMLYFTDSDGYLYAYGLS